MHSQDIRQSAYGPAADQMAVTIVDPFQAVKVQQEMAKERPVRASAGFRNPSR